MATSRNNGRPYPKLVFGETLSVAVQTFRTNKLRFILTTLGMVIGTASRPPAPHACELPSPQRPQRVPRQPQRRPRTRFLLRLTPPHSRNPHLRSWIFLANLLIAPPIVNLVLGLRMPPYPNSDLPLAPVSCRCPQSSCGLSS